MADVLVGVVSSAAAPPLYAWASHRGCAWDRRNPSRAETAWNMTTNIRYKNRMMKSGKSYSVFTRFLLGLTDEMLMISLFLPVRLLLMLMLPMMMMMMMVAFRGQWGEKRQTSPHFAILLSMNSVHFHRDKPLDKKSLECKLYCYILCFQITLVCSCSRLRGLTSFRQIVSHTLDWRTLFLILSAVSIILKHQSRACLEDIWSLLAVSVVLSSGRGWWCCFSLEVLSWLQEQECVCVCVCEWTLRSVCGEDTCVSGDHS